MLWEIPTAIFLVNSFLLGLVSITKFPVIVEKVIIIFGLSFTIVFTWALFKAVKRALNRAGELKKIEQKRGLPRYGKEESWWLKAPLGYFTVILLMVLILFLIYLLINPHPLSG